MWIATCLQPPPYLRPPYLLLPFKLNLHHQHSPLLSYSYQLRPSSCGSSSGGSTNTSTSTSTSSFVHNYNDSIQSFCKKGQLEEALRLLFHEPNPTQRTYELLILSCSHNRSLSHALTVHRKLIQDGFQQDPFLSTKLINLYSHLDRIDLVRQVFYDISNPTIFVWNAFFRALTLAGQGHKVFHFYRSMNRIGIPSDRFTYTFVLKACVASESSTSLLRKGKEIHANILRHGYESHLHIMTTLIDVYARFGCIDNASRVFYEMPEKNLVSWSAMIACYARNGKPLKALDLLGDMVSYGLMPNSVTMVSVLQACASLAALEQGKLLHGYILRKGLDSILPVLSALVTMYARCGALELGRRVFDQMGKRDVVAWNSIISSYGIHGFGAKAIETFREMILHGVTPTPISFVSVLGACGHAGLVAEGKQLFDSMSTLYKMHPIVEHYACMVDLLGRANLLEEAAIIIQDMRIEPGPNVWGSLLGSCRIHCNVELAERAGRRLIELEPTNAGNYVLLADIYAKVGMWDEVKRVRKLMEAKGLQKVSGCSWIEVNRKIYSLQSVDEINPQIEQIHALLLQLSTEMKQHGYVPDTKIVLYDLEEVEKERILLGHSEKLAVAFGLINSSKGMPIRISKNLRLCEDCHSFTKSISKYTSREVVVKDINRIHHFRDGVCSCGDYW